jgi:hypothetical protein
MVVSDTVVEDHPPIVVVIGRLRASLLRLDEGAGLGLDLPSRNAVRLLRCIALDLEGVNCLDILREGWFHSLMRRSSSTARDRRLCNILWQRLSSSVKRRKCGARSSACWHVQISWKFICAWAAEAS